MQDRYPSLPPRTYGRSRALRIFLFSFVVSALVLSILVVLVGFVWDGWARKLFEPDRAEYDVNVYYVVPSIVILSLIVSKYLWDSAEGRTAPRRRA